MSKDRIGFPKNSAFVDGAEEVYRRLGYDTGPVDLESRSYRQDTDDAEFYLMRAQDIPEAVDRGWIDLGMTGEDILEEYCLAEDLATPEYCRLGFGEAELWLAAGGPVPENPVVATSYPEITCQYLNQEFEEYAVVEAEGSVEVFPEFEGIDAVVEVVDSGRTLRQNGLEKVDRILSSEAVLIGEEVFTSEVLKNPVPNQSTGEIKR